MRWRLAELMTRYRVQGRDLATYLQISDNAMSSLKNAESMPRIDGQRLISICQGLNQLGQNRERIITPYDLLEFSEEEFEPE